MKISPEACHVSQRSLQLHQRSVTLCVCLNDNVQSSEKIEPCVDLCGLLARRLIQRSRSLREELQETLEQEPEQEPEQESIEQELFE